MRTDRIRIFVVYYEYKGKRHVGCISMSLGSARYIAESLELAGYPTTIREEYHEPQYYKHPAPAIH